jgi:hypothetical protein
MSVGELKREVLVRHLETWAGAALHKRRAAYVHSSADADGGVLAEAALGVFAEQSDLVRGRELALLFVGADTGALSQRLGAVGAIAPGLSVHVVDAPIGVAVKAAGAVRVPVMGFLTSTDDVAALVGGKPAEVLLTLPAGATGYRETLRAAGFTLVAAVELAEGDAPGELLVFATSLGKSLESFKETLWAVDEFAGVRYRDPGDPDRHLIDISLNPHPGPLRRELLARLTADGPATVTELRTFALADTIYRAADATRVLQTMLSSGAVAREPEQGRLAGDTVIRAL